MSFTITSKSSITSTTANTTTSSSTTTKLTPEQLKRMEENRLKALHLKQKAKSELASISSTNSQTHTKINTLSTISQSTATKTTAGVIAATTSPTKTNQTISATYGICVYLENESEPRFEVQIGYNKAVIDLFKTIGSRRYEPTTKRWSFAMKNYDELLLKIKHEFNNTIKLKPLDRVSMAASKIAKFILIDRHSFEVQAEYNSVLQEIFKTIESKKYDPLSKRWSFNLKDYNPLVAKINAMFTRGEVTVSPLPKAVREIFKASLEGKNDSRFDQKFDFNYIKNKIDLNIAKSLLPFQIEGICFSIQQNGRILLADDMGLGKTIQGLAIASYYKDEWPAFIIVPSSVKFMWKESAKKWLANTLAEVCDYVNLEDSIQVLENSKQPIDPDCKIIISSYDLLAKNVDEISQFHYKVIIADECHLLKNGKASRTKAALKLIQNCNRVILLSGTPALSRPAELFSQIQAINPTLFSSFHEYGTRYCDGKESKFGWDFSGYSNMTELRTLLEEKLLIRREKKDVIQQLPTKMREMVILNPNLIELNVRSLKVASNKMQNDDLKGMEKRGALLGYFQETCKVKAKAVCEYVIDLLEADKKFLVFAHHQNMLDELEKECLTHKYEYIRIDGSTNSEKRQHFVDKFQNDDNCKCALLSITAANSGITLTQAHLVVFAELFWNPGILVQAEDRVYRIGQKNSVIIQYLCAKGTADDYIWPLVNEKLSVLSRAGLTRENLSEASTVDNNNNKNVNLFKEYFIEEVKPDESFATAESDATAKTNEENSIKENKIPTSSKYPTENNRHQVKIDTVVNSNKNENKLQVESKTVFVSNAKSENNQQQIDALLNGIDFANFDSPPTKKVKQ